MRGRRVEVYAKPVRAPRWWPRDGAREVCWVGLLADGAGWVVGDGDPMTAAEARTARQIFAENQTDDRGRKRLFNFKEIKK